ncbi:heavy metal-associated isoprenylated plant protein 7-like isoform X1 [Iris pallida]|uniref:Heavy metal-associated isoprenylated plant protein 7-like isoform X1 n=1 Tax=Iris pallida TaxID=29817 RepID=A0AAX6DTJ1_IRIPA|nr:heavy metal-associated isoprenylated plant protein 7-like isoform X1 [Iris pallida]
MCSRDQEEDTENERCVGRLGAEGLAGDREGGVRPAEARRVRPQEDRQARRDRQGRAGREEGCWGRKAEGGGGGGGGGEKVKAKAKDEKKDGDKAEGEKKDKEGDSKEEAKKESSTEETAGGQQHAHCGSEGGAEEERDVLLLSEHSEIPDGVRRGRVSADAPPAVAYAPQPPAIAYPPQMFSDENPNACSVM